MGCGTSAVTKAEADARKATDAVDKAFEEDSNKEEERIKLLLLGSSRARWAARQFHKPAFF